MRFSLITLITVLTLIAWGLGIAQVPNGYRLEAVFGSFLTLALVVVVSALASPSRDGKLDVDANEFFRVLEPAFKFTLSLFLISLVIGILALLYGFGVLMFGTF